MANESSATEFEMRSRIARTSSDIEKRRESPPTYNETVIVEKKIKPGDTLNKIAIQYAVNVSDIKRVNNLVSDQDFAVLSVVKVPISRMRQALGGIGTSTDEEEHFHDISDRTRLLDEHDRSRDPSVEEIFQKMDSTIAQVRETLPENGIPGSFHFVDAKPPDSGCSVLALLLGVVVIFMIIPLVLTFLEESENNG